MRLSVGQRVGRSRGRNAIAWYVSSINGNNANTGRSSASQLQTLGALFANPEFKSGQTVILEDGSRWRESFNLTQGNRTGVTVRRSNTGTSRPIIDGCDPISNANLTQDPTNTNCYTLNFTPAYGAGTDTNRISVFEDSTPLFRRTSIALCNSNPGSFFAGFPNTGVAQTVYIHPRGTTPPGSKLFEITTRAIGLQLANGCEVDGIEAMRVGINMGPIYAADNIFVTLRNCISRWGTKHMMVLSGCLVEDTQAIDIVPGNTDCIPFTAFDGFAFTRDATFRRCTATVQPGLVTGAAWYAHGTASGNIRNFLLEDCVANETSSGFSELCLNRADFIRCTYARATNPGIAFTTVSKSTGGSILGCYAPACNSFVSLPTRLTSPLKIWGNKGAVNNNYCIVASAGASKLDCRYNSFSGALPGYYVVNPAGVPIESFIWRNNIVSRGAAVANTLLHRSSAGLDIANNMYFTGLAFNNDAFNNQNLATAQSLGLELNSVNLNPGFVDPANGNYTTSGAGATKAAELQAGVEYYVPA